MALTATFVDADTFTVVGDRTADFVVNRKVRCDCGVDGYKYAVVSASSYGAPNTTVDLTADSDDLTNNLVYVDWSVVKTGTAGNIPLHDHSDEDAGGATGRIAAIIGGVTVGYSKLIAANDVDGDATTIIANGTGDVTAGLYAMVIVKPSAGAVDYGVVYCANNSSEELYGGTDVCTLTVNADGSAEVQRTAGSSLTFDIVLFALWI